MTSLRHPENREKPFFCFKIEFLMKKTTKILLISASIFALIVILAIVFISPITKYAIEKYDERYTGRKITMDWAYVNPFSGYIHFENVQIREFESDSIFIKIAGISSHIKVFKLWSKTFEMEEIVLEKPIVTVIQTEKNFNFNDLIKLFSSEEKKGDFPKEKEDPSVSNGFLLPRIKINDGTFYYHEKVIPIDYFIKNVHFESTEKRVNIDTIDAKFSFLPGVGTGDFKGNFTYNLENKDYRFAAITHKLDLQIFEQYLKDLTNYGKFSANLDADVHVKGNLDEKANISTTGKIALNDVHFGKTKEEDYASFNRLALVMDEVSPINRKYFFDSITLIKPYFKYEKYDNMDNLQMMFGKKMVNIDVAQSNPERFNLIIEIANRLKILSKYFPKSHYKLNKLAVYDGDFKFNDFSTSEQFSINLNPFFINADSIDKKHRNVEIYLKSALEPYGNAKVMLRMNPKDTSEFDINYQFEKLPATLFNPYIISYTSFELDRGTVEFNGNWQVKNGNLESQNHLVIIDPRVSKRIKNADNRRLPLPLIMAFIRERGNVIDYQIPLTGSLKNPKFHLRDAIFDLIKNIFIKPVTIPYGVKVKTTEAKIEKLLTLNWGMRSASISQNQAKFMGKMADFLKKTPEAILTIHPQQYATKEKEYILFFEAKKKYFKAINNKNEASFSEADSIKVAKMSVKDADFVRYLAKIKDSSMLFTIQSRCSKLVNSTVVNAKYKQLNAERERVFWAFFREKELDKQIKMGRSKDVVPYNGFSFYRIVYRGEFPEDLIKAYQQLEALDETAPRSKFAEVRQKSGGIFGFLFRNRRLKAEKKRMEADSLLKLKIKN
jgi:hypothetical protein